MKEDLKKILIDNMNLDNNNGFEYPLIENTYNEEEIIEMIDVLLSNRLTMGKRVEKFEKEFAEYVGSKYAVMVNSGSSANLLAMAVATNILRQNRLNDGNKVLVPNICWSTSVFPIIQMGLKPILVDIDPVTMNINVDKVEELVKSDNSIKGIVMVHVLGNTCNMEKLKNIVKNNNLFLMEDTCESLGSKYNGQYLGTFGDFGTYSFYYSHHITTIEGGMVVCNDENDYELLKCLRAHGWTRYLKNKDRYEEMYPEIDPRFLFVNLGYNLRPMEIQAAMGSIQLKKLHEKNQNRNKNHDTITNLIINNSRNKDIFMAPIAVENSDPAWFSLSFIIGEKYEKYLKEFLIYLTSNGIENRPIVTGNFSRQPVFKYLNIQTNSDEFKGAEVLHKRGFFIGLSCSEMSLEKINKLVNIIYNFPYFLQES